MCFFKDGISDYVVDGDLAAVNPDRIGTKAATLYRPTLPAEGTVTLVRQEAGVIQPVEVRPR
jgi:hypothetical protein